MKKYVNISLFIVIIFFFFGGYLVKLNSSQLISKDAIELEYSSNDMCKDELIDLYGLVQKCFGKKAIENVTLFKNAYGKITSPQAENSKAEIVGAVDCISPIWQYLEQEEIPYYYVTSLLPIADEADLPIGVEDYSAENATVLLRILTDLQVPIIDIRNQIQMESIPKEELFYRTDHHWTMKACFSAFQIVMKTVENDLEWNLTEYTGIEQYDEYRTQDDFLGSYGIKVGKYYAGKDDFIVYIPRVQTNLSFKAYDADQRLVMEKTGNFMNALMDTEILKDVEYNNKYNAFLNACSIENRIVNNLADNDKKVLLISHSYGRPLAQYFSLCFKEVRMLDPQEGRFNGNYLQYIEEYQPDLVLFLVEFEGEIIGNYCVE